MSLILSGSDGLSDVDGSASTPAIRGTDANTGIFFPAADTIAFAEGGAEVARFDSSGRLLIGTTSASGNPATLEVAGASPSGEYNAQVQVRTTTQNTNDKSRISFFHSSHGTAYIQSNYDSSGNGNLQFATRGGGDPTVRATITSAGNFQFNSGYGSVATAYGCRVWVNFNGTGTPAIRASGNVTSITDNGTGDFTVNFTTAMPDANYNIVSMGQRNDFNNGDMLVSIYGNVYGTAITTSSVRINTAHASSFTLSDALTACISVFR